MEKNGRRIKFGVGGRELWESKLSIMNIDGLPMGQPFGEVESAFDMEVDVCSGKTLCYGLSLGLMSIQMALRTLVLDDHLRSEVTKINNLKKKLV